MCTCVSMCVLTCGPSRKVLTPMGSQVHTSPQQQANGSRVNVLYSTPACYLWELYKANLTWYLGVLGSFGLLACPVSHDPALSVSAAAGP